MHINDLAMGDYVSHPLAPHTVWKVVDYSPYRRYGGTATLKWVGGTAITLDVKRAIMAVYTDGNDAFIRELTPANPMLVIALEAK